ncbi:ABC transporter permease [Ferviditalea candida]|uniref:Transport permease protein n=1 Tax=Ferviditalea candida TaxID=3108399 RepID=A0ABU5ZEK3_9BACL|nr:ABC transporter permease [Paenibacillaceae bacterium T2]
MRTVMNKYITYLKTFNKYYYLLTLLVKKDIKKKYKGSFLGILWSLLNPLLNMIVLTIVFSTLFKENVHNFPVYMLSGQLLFGFFSSSTMGSLNSVISSASLINKVYVPKYIFTFSRLMSDFVFFAISLVDLLLIMIVTRADITINIMYAPIYLLLLLVFSSGVSLILATVTVFFRDIEHLYGVFITFLMYGSAIFYPASIIPDKFQFILTLNPVFYFINGFRNVVYDGFPVDSTNLMICLTLAVISLIIGIVVFEKNQDKFILHI